MTESSTRTLHATAIAPHASDLLDRFLAVRSQSLALVEPLSAEDACAQSMPDASPAKWHLAHTTWFFETFILEQLERPFTPFDPAFRVLFNSYYNSVGEQHPRPQRGLVTRPALERVLEYRHAVDARIAAAADAIAGRGLNALLETGIQHEQQHQELLLMDIKHLFSCNPLAPAYRQRDPLPVAATVPQTFIPIDGGLVDVGTSADSFCFDNERPRHRQYVGDFAIGARAVTNAEYLEFIDAGAYDEPMLWLSDGWDKIRQTARRAPLYWRRGDSGWQELTLYGLETLQPASPVCHVSYYEADAFARWAGYRLPTETEWEVAAAGAEPGQDLESSAAPAYSPTGLHPAPAATAGRLTQMLDTVWQWTSSAYAPYPGFCPAAGALGEYNGKFMSGQMVLRGGACVTPAGHTRATYRNFFYPGMSWQFGGIRLAADR